MVPGLVGPGTFSILENLRTIDQLEETIAAFDARIEDKLTPFRDKVERLKEVPGLALLLQKSCSPRLAST